MAFNLQIFKTRTITAIVFAIVMLAGLFWNRWSFLVLFIIIHFGCWFELVKIMKKIFPNKTLLFSLVGLIYITLPVFLLLTLRLGNSLYTWFGDDKSWIIPVAIIFSIWINDTMAYIVGSLCVVAMGIIANYSGYLLVKEAVMIAALCAIFGTLGDLFESKLKRMAGIKDSGSFMPGHGGFLDRFDSLLFAVPVVWIYVNGFM
jgi:phosphatidate cytidylyltransferase